MGHQTEDVIGFCVDFIPGLKKIGLPKSRYEGRLTGKGMLGGDSIICRDGYSWFQAHYTILQNSTLVTRMSMNTRIFCVPNTQRSVTTGLHVNTSGLSAVGWKHVSEVTTLFLMSCTHWPGTIVDCIDLQRIPDKWEYILHDRPRSKEHQPKQRCPL